MIMSSTYPVVAKEPVKPFVATTVTNPSAVELLYLIVFRGPNSSPFFIGYDISLCIQLKAIFTDSPDALGIASKQLDGSELFLCCIRSVWLLRRNEMSTVFVPIHL
jgi:hypothetical protein